MFFEQFENLCSKNNTTPTKFVTEILKLSSSKVTAWKNGSIPKYRTLNLIAEYFGVTVGELFDGTKQKSSNNKLSDNETELLFYYNKLSEINKGKVIGTAKVLSEIEALEPDRNENEDPETIFIEYSTCSVSAGTGEPLIDDSQPDFIEVISSDLTEQANFAVKINGDSMLPRFKNDDIVLVRSQPSVEVGEIGIFIVDGCGYIKEYASDRLVSLNPEYDDIYFSEGQEVWCKGRVIGILEDEDFV